MRRFFNVIHILLCMYCCNCLPAQFELCQWQNYQIWSKDDILSDKYAKFRNDAYFGVISIDGDTILPQIYQDIYYFWPGIFVCQKKGKFGIYNERNETILAHEFDKIRVFKHGIQAVLKGKPIFFDFDGKTHNDSIFSHYVVLQESDDLLVISDGSDRSGIKYNNGEWLIPYSDMHFDISNPDIIIRYDGLKKDILNRKGKKLNDKSFVRLEKYGQHIIGKTDELEWYQIYTLDGSIVNSLPPFKEYKIEKNYLIVHDHEKERIYDLSLDTKFEAKASQNKYSFYENYFFENCNLNKNDSYFFGEMEDNGHLYKNFRPISKNKYYRIDQYEGSFLCARSNGIDILDKDGNIIQSFNPNIAVVYQKYGSIMSRGNYIDSIYFLDEKRYIKIEKCEHILFLTHRHIFTSNLGKINLYSKDGVLLVKDIKDMNNITLTFECSYYVFTRYNKKGWVIDDMVVLPQYTDLHIISEKFVLVFIDNKWKIVHNDGSDFDGRSYSSFEDCVGGLILKNSENYTYVSKKIKNNSTLRTFSEYKKASQMLALKYSDKWRLFCQYNDTLFQEEFENIEFKNILIHTNKGKYYIDYIKSALVPLNFDTVYEYNYTIIGVKDKKHFVQYNDYQAQNPFAFREFDCDSLKIKSSDLLIYKNAKISYYQTYGNRYLVENVDSIILFDDNFYVSKIGSTHQLYLYKKLKKEFDQISNISRELHSLLIFTRDDRKWLYDATQDTTLLMNYHNYKHYEKGIYLVENHFKYGVLNHRHQEILPCQYDNIKLFDDDRFIQVVKDGQQALMDRSGNVCIPFDLYQNGFTNSRNLIFAQKGTYHGVYNITENKWYPPTKYQDIKDCNIRLDGVGNVFSFRENGLYGLMDDHCNILISASFDQVKVEDQFIILSKEKEKYMFLANTKRPSDKAYSEIFVHKDYWLGTYGDTFDLYENNHLVKTFLGYFPIFDPYLNTIGYTIDIPENGDSRDMVFSMSSMKEIFAPNYTQINSINYASYVVKDTLENFYLMNLDGFILNKQSFTEYKYIGNENLVVKMGDKYGAIDLEGNEVLQPTYAQWEIINGEKGNNYNVKSNGKIDVFDDKFQFLFTSDYDYIGNFTGGLAPVRKGEKWGYIDHRGKIAIPLSFDYADDFGDQNYSAFVFLDHKFYEINIQGIINPVEYFNVNISKFSLLMSESAKFNKKMYLILKPNLQNTSSLYITVKNMETAKYGVTDIMFNEIIPAKYDEIIEIGSSRQIHVFAYKMNNKFGLISREGKLITEPIYDKVENYEWKCLKVIEGSQTFLLGYDGKKI